MQVSQAAAHANDSMKRIEQFKKLLEVQESIGGGIDLVSPTREVLKEGKMVKISARTGDHQDRYLFLVRDDDTRLMCLCSYHRVSCMKYQVVQYVFLVVCLYTAYYLYDTYTKCDISKNTQSSFLWLKGGSEAKAGLTVEK